MAARPSDMLNDLDGERPDEPFVVQVDGRPIVLAPAAGPRWDDLMEALAWPPTFVRLFVDDVDQETIERLPIWQMRAVLRAWRLHHGLCADDADHLRLAGALGKPAYRAAAEQDLWEIHRLDLNIEWQSRRWRRLLNMLDGLRRTSHVQEALAMDEQLAEQYLELQRRHGRRDEPRRKATRRVSEFSVEAELLSFAVDRLGELLVAHAVSRGGRRRKVEPMPRPDSALHRVKERNSRRHHKYTVARMFGYVDEKGRPTGHGPAPPDASPA